MKISFQRSYKSQNGNPVFVYGVKATPAEISKMKEIQGDYYREDDKGNPLFFTTRYAGKIGELIITTNDNLVVDTSKFDAAASMAAQYGGNFGQALANQAAAQLLGGGESDSESSSSSNSSAQSQVEETSTEEESLDQA